MSSPHADQRQRSRRRLIITLITTGLILLLLTGIGIYGLITGPTPQDPGGSSHPGASEPPGTPGEDPGARELPSLPRTDDPEKYVRAVAEALFAWDTFTLLTPADHRAVLIEDADPTGTETPGLIADLDGYFPSAQTWRDLAEYRTRQHLEIEDVFVPEQWHEAVAAAGDEIADGTIAYTVDGVRHRQGVWYGDAVSSAHPVAFTVFVACEPVFDRCQLLRLSQLDNPLR
jgi:hypothetical protein